MKGPGEGCAASVLVICVVLIVNCAARGEAPALAYDSSKTTMYLGQTIRGSAAGSAAELRKGLSAAIDEMLDGPWLPLYSDYSAGEAGGVGIAEWCFDRPGDYLLVLAQAEPYMDAQQRPKAAAFVRNLIKSSRPTRQVYITGREGKSRNVRKSPGYRAVSLPASESQRRNFESAYAIWTFAQAFDEWDEAKPMFEDLKELRAQLETRGDFAPSYKPEFAGGLTAADTKDPEYRFRVYQSLLSGFQDNYGYQGARAARARMEKDKPVFFYVKTLSALIGYHRLAEHFGDAGEARWAQKTFDGVAGMTLAQKSAPFLWSDPALCPEVGRLIRDAAGNWLQELGKTPNVGNLPATDWDGRIVPGKRDYQVMNPYTWYHAWGGQGEGVRPRTVMGAFLANACLFNATPEQIARTVDIPWCRADLYYAAKLIVAIQAAEKTPWTRLREGR